MLVKTDHVRSAKIKIILSVIKMRCRGTTPLVVRKCTIIDIPLNAIVRQSWNNCVSYYRLQNRIYQYVFSFLRSIDPIVVNLWSLPIPIPIPVPPPNYNCTVIFNPPIKVENDITIQWYFFLPRTFSLVLFPVTLYLIDYPRIYEHFIVNFLVCVQFQ